MPGLVVKADDAHRDLSRLDPENRRRIERLLRLRPVRLAALNAEGCWPRCFAQVPAVMRAMADELAVGLGDDHPLVRAHRGG